MNSLAKHMMIRINVIIVFMLTVALLSGCGGEADTINPDAISQSPPTALTGTVYPQIISAYPDNGSTGIAADTDIVVVFSKPVDLGTIPANITINPGAVAYAVSPASDDRTVILNPGASLSFSTTYTVSISTGITDQDAPPHALSSAGSFSFTTAANGSSSLQPRVIAATRYPADGSTVGIGQSYVEVTFTEQVDNVDNATFTIFDGPTDMSLGAPVSTDNKTWRLYIDTAMSDYSTTYAVDLSTTIHKLGDVSSTLINANLSWTYDTEVDPAAAGYVIEDIWVDSVSKTGAVVKFVSSKSFTSADSYIQTGVATGVYTVDHNEGGAVDRTVHTVNLGGLTSGTIYFFRAWLDVDNSGTVNAGDITSVEFSFSTANATDLLSSITNQNFDQNGFQLLQTNNIGSYVFWVSNQAGNLDIYGQYFNPAGGAPVWGATTISTHVNPQSGIAAITDGFDEAVIIYNDSNNLYAKMVDPAGLKASWLLGVANQGANLGIAIGHGIAIVAGTADSVSVPTELRSSTNADFLLVTAGDSIHNTTDNTWGVATGAGEWFGSYYRIPIAGSVALLNDGDNFLIYEKSQYSACIVHERPLIVSSGVAERPTPLTTNLLYDADTDFTFLGLADSDLLIWENPAGVWNSNVLYNTNSFNIFSYVLRSSANILLNSYNYYLADQVSTASSTVTSVVDATHFQADDLNLFVNGNPGDVINCNGTWAIIVSKTFIAGITHEIETNVNHGLVLTDPYTVYPKIAGPLISEAVSNPLWDNLPVPLFNPGFNVLTGDYLVNEQGGGNVQTLWDTITTVVEDTNYSLQLDTGDTVENGDIYSIIRLPSGAFFRGVGHSTVLADFTFTDAVTPIPAFTPGDIVFNIDQNISAMVVTSGVASSTLTADIFNAANEKAIVYTKRGFLVAYVDTSEFIRARAFNIDDGSPLGAAFNVCTNGSNSNPVAVSNGGGDAIIFYEKSTGIYVKKVSARGEFFGAWGVNADAATDAGIAVLGAGFTIVQALPDGAPNATGGAYLLAENKGAGNFRLVHVGGNTATITDTSGALAVTGYNPQMVVDHESGQFNRVIVVYRNTHLSGGVNYYHIEARAYRAPAVSLWTLIGAASVSSDAVAYNCVQPSITLASNTNVADSFYIAWFDARFFNPSGYSIYAQQYSSAPLRIWAAGGVQVSAPTSMGYDYPLYMKLLYYDDGLSPYGVMPVWLDYRDYAGTGTDIYYEQIVN